MPAAVEALEAAGLGEREREREREEGEQAAAMQRGFGSGASQASAGSKRRGAHAAFSLPQGWSDGGGLSVGGRAGRHRGGAGGLASGASTLGGGGYGYGSAFGGGGGPLSAFSALQTRQTMALGELDSTYGAALSRRGADAADGRVAARRRTERLRFLLEFPFAPPRAPPRHGHGHSHGAAAAAQTTTTSFVDATVTRCVALLAARLAPAAGGAGAFEDAPQQQAGALAPQLLRLAFLEDAAALQAQARRADEDAAM